MSSDQVISRLKSQSNRLPNKPGVYIMSNDNDKVIYVGKAKGLKNRVRSYFTPKPANEKVEAILKEIVSIDTTVTITEREALILENTLIKKHNPKFNVLLKGCVGVMANIRLTSRSRLFCLQLLSQIKCSLRLKIV